jgi:hypothetical protein
MVIIRKSRTGICWSETIWETPSNDYTAIIGIPEIVALPREDIGSKIFVRLFKAVVHHMDPYALPKQPTIPYRHYIGILSDCPTVLPCVLQMPLISKQWVVDYW